MTTMDLTDRLERIETRLEVLVEEAQRQGRLRDSVSELASDLAPVGLEAMGAAARWLETVDGGELLPTLETLLRSLSDLERAMRAIRPMLELVETVSELGKPAMESMTRSLATLDGRGYFDFARSGVRVVDRVVTGFDEADIEALGDNVVLILETLRDMTQPEVMQMLRRTLASAGGDEIADPPGLLGLMRLMRKPETRRGLARMINALDSLGMNTAHDTQEVK